MIHKDFNPLSLQQQKSLKEVALRLFRKDLKPDGLFLN